ncbi:MAG: glycosyltransferase 87 family protein [Chlamydiota bacterium]
MKPPGNSQRVATAVICAYGVYCIVHIALGPERFQWDFCTYYYAARAWASGSSPYDGAVVAAVAGRPLNLYPYLPITLFLFRPFLLTDYRTATMLFLGLKVLLLCGLMTVWWRGFVKGGSAVLFALLCLFAYRSALFLEMRAGNVFLLEQLLVWVGFACLLRRRFAWFCALILAGALFKITTVLFLFLLLCVEGPRRKGWFWGGWAAFLVIIAASAVSAPWLFNEFLRTAAIKLGDESGLHQPSTLACMRDAVGLLASRGYALPPAAAGAAYAAVAAGVVVTSACAVSVSRRRGRADAGMTAVCLGCLVYALVLPRFKDYYYILLLVPSYFAVSRAPAGAASALLCAMVILPSLLSAENPLPIFTHDAAALGLFWEYYPLVVAVLVWVLTIAKAVAPEPETGHDA